jgi:hypothetical protein
LIVNRVGWDAAQALSHISSSGGAVDGLLGQLLARAAQALLELLIVQLLRWLWDAMKPRPSAPQPA